MASEEEARRLLSAVAGRLGQLPNVVGVGVVPAGDAGGGSAVAVYVHTKVPKAALKPHEIVPDTVTETVDGQTVQAPTRVIRVGEIKF